MIPTPATAINDVLDAHALPHVRRLRCDSKRGVCFGTVAGYRTTWFIAQASGRARLVCVCTLPLGVRPIARP